MTEKIPGWLERVLLPKLSVMEGDIKAVNIRIDGLDAKLSAKIDAVDEKLSAKIDSLDKRLDMAQRLAILETKMGELRPKA